MDQLTVVMVLVVTGVGFLIHIYSTGYMAHEGGYYRFFSYLNLFMFFMLILVLAANYVLLFVGWEGVGLASYLLIGFYFLKKSASDAGKKAFIVNRIGDFGFMLGMFLLFRTFHTLDFSELFSEIARKSGLDRRRLGRFRHHDRRRPAPLHGSLRQIRAASALRLAARRHGRPHAGQRVDPRRNHGHRWRLRRRPLARDLFEHSETALVVVAVIGCATALFAATIGLVQTDIKKVLAYSTVSQLGYMFLACGVGAFGAGIFHLMTHAFFKALLFLAAGSVIHAMGGEQDMRHMGGLSKKIKVTYWTMLIATLAIAGFPPLRRISSRKTRFSSARSPSAWQRHGGHVLYAVGLLTALLTAFYMFRLIFLTFHGKQRYDEHHVHVHESPWSMLGPLVVLAVLSIIGGWFALPLVLGAAADHFAEFPFADFRRAQVKSNGTERSRRPLSRTYSCRRRRRHRNQSACFTAFWLYLEAARQARATRQIAAKAVYNTLLNKYYVDELYAAAIVRPLVWLSENVLWKVVDVEAIDGTVNGIAHGATSVGDTVRHTQSGNTRSYAVWVVVGALAIILILFWPALHALVAPAQAAVTK